MNHPLTLHVSPGGDDSAPGTSERPLATPEAARQLLRHRRQGRRDLSAVVRFAPGVYRLTTPLRLEADDGGDATSEVRYEAERPGSVTLSGARPLEWTREGDLCCCRFDDRPFARFFDGDRVIRRASSDYFRTLENFEDTREIAVPVDAVEAVGGVDALRESELVLLEHWADVRLKLAGCRLEGKQALLRFDDEPGRIHFTRPFPQRRPGRSAYFDNVFHNPIQAGTFFLDRRAGTAYCCSDTHSSPDPRNSLAPFLETLLSIRGTPEEPVRGLHIAGIRFMHTNWHRPLDHGFINGQGGVYNLDADLDNNQWIARQPAALYAEHADRLVVSQCCFEHAGAAGIDLHRGVSHSLVENCNFDNMAGCGIVLGVFSDPDIEMHTPYLPADHREICSDNLIRSNNIRRVGVDFHGSCGIAAGYPARVVIADNTIEDVPYSAISLGWGWTSIPNAMRYNRITGNTIRRAMRLLYDGAAIYTLSRQPGTRVDHNRIEDVQSSGLGREDDKTPRAIYLDAASGGSLAEPFLVDHNLIERVDVEAPIKTKSNGSYVILKDNLNGAAPAKNAP